MLNEHDLEDMKADELPPRDPSKPATEQGIFGKFHVCRLDGKDAPGGPKEGARYFVLDLTHDPFAVPAIMAYAKACSATHMELAADLVTMLPDPAEACRHQWGKGVAHPVCIDCGAPADPQCIAVATDPAQTQP